MIYRAGAPVAVYWSGTVFFTRPVSGADRRRILEMVADQEGHEVDQDELGGLKLAGIQRDAADIA